MPRALRALCALVACAAPAAASPCGALRGTEPVHVRNSADLASAAPRLGSAAASVLLEAGTYVLPRTLVLSSCSRLAARPGQNAAAVLKLAPSASHPVVAIRNGTGVSLRGVHIIGHNDSAQWSAALDIAEGERVSVEGITLVGGLFVRGGFGHRIRTSVISNPSARSHGNCVWLYQAGEPKTLTKADHEISNNEIHECRGLGNPWPTNFHRHHRPTPDPFPDITGNGVLIDRTVGVVVRNNFIHDVNYHGVFTQGRLHAKYPDPRESPAALNVIELNRIENWYQCVSQPVCREHGYRGADGACLYFWTYLWGHGQKALNNLCRQGRPDLWGGKGIYADGASSGIEASGNILVDVPRNIIDNNNGHDNHYFANIAINGNHMGSLTDANFWRAKGGIHDTAHFGHGCHNPAQPQSFNLTRTIMEYAGTPAWRNQFPSILTWLNRSSWMGRSCDPHNQGMDCCMFPTGTVANYTVMVNAKGTRGRPLSQNFCGNTAAFDPPVGCWPNAAGFQRVGPQKIYREDPGFVDMAGGDFALRADARIFADFPGFPDIPFGKIGPVALPRARAPPSEPPGTLQFV